MFTRATPALFREWIGHYLDQALKRAERAVDETWAQAAVRGFGGGTIKVTIRVVKEQLELGTDAALGELKRTIRVGELDPEDLRGITQELLEQFVVRAKQATRHERMREKASDRAGMAIDKLLAEFDEVVAFKLRHFDAGLFDPAEPESPISYSMTVGTMVGSAIQQGSPGAAQTLSYSVNVQEAQTALSVLEQALAAIKLENSVRADLHADIITLRAQLGKPHPSVDLVRQAGRSLRSVVEGVVAAIAAPEVVIAAAALWSALGF